MKKLLITAVLVTASTQSFATKFLTQVADNDAVNKMNSIVYEASYKPLYEKYFDNRGGGVLSGQYVYGNSMCGISVISITGTHNMNNDTVTVFNDSIIVNTVSTYNVNTEKECQRKYAEALIRNGDALKTKLESLFGKR